jgi:Ca-activated chloride channel homolog
MTITVEREVLDTTHLPMTQQYPSNSKKWQPNAPYIARFKAASDTDLYAVYLDERTNYRSSTAFYLDAADIFFDRKQPDLALRVLSNLAEMNLDNRQYCVF